MPHIPKGTTDTVALELFEPALEAALRPSPDYDVDRWLYVPNTYSYTVTSWAPGAGVP